MNEEHGFDHAFEHEDGKSQAMEASQGLWKARSLRYRSRLVPSGRYDLDTAIMPDGTVFVQG